MIEDTLMRQQVEEITRGSQFPKKSRARTRSCVDHGLSFLNDHHYFQHVEERCIASRREAGRVSSGVLVDALGNRRSRFFVAQKP